MQSDCFLVMMGTENMFGHCMTLEDGSDTFSSGVYFREKKPSLVIPLWSLIYLRNKWVHFVCSMFDIIICDFVRRCLFYEYISLAECECCEKATIMTNYLLFCSGGGYKWHFCCNEN